MQEPREDLSADRRGLWLLGNTAARREEAVRGDEWQSLSGGDRRGQRDCRAQLLSGDRCVREGTGIQGSKPGKPCGQVSHVCTRAPQSLGSQCWETLAGKISPNLPTLLPLLKHYIPSSRGFLPRNLLSQTG